MNKMQRVGILVGVGVIVLMGLFPPWESGRYSPIFAPHDWEPDPIDTTRLAVQCAVVAVATVGWVVAWRPDTPS